MERKHVQFTDRDGLIVQAVFVARYLTTDQVGHLFFGGQVSSSCKKRLRYLFDRGYLRKRLVHPNEPDVYFLGLQGRHYIAKVSDGYSKEEIDKLAGVPGDGEAPSLMLSHDLAVSSLYVRAALECRERGWTLEWRNSRELELRRLGVQPDAYLAVNGGDFEKRAFLEFTSVLPTQAEMKGKLDGYQSLIEKLGGVPVLWFTTSRSKLEHLSRQVSRFIYHDWILLGLIDDSSGFLTRKMWWWSESSEPVRFTTPDEEGRGGSA